MKQNSYIKQKPFLSITEASHFIGVSRPTIYAYIKNKELNPMRLGNKTLISIDEIYDKFNTFNINYFKPMQEKAPILSFYTIDEIKEKYKVKDSWIFKIIREQHIPKVKKQGKGYYSQKHIDDYFKKNQADESITEWYSVKEIQEKFDMSLNAIYSFVYENNIPKKRDGVNSFYSKNHFDIAKGVSTDEVLYYTSQEAMAKYNLTKDGLYHYVKYHNIPKIRVGKFIKISRREFDKLFEQPTL